MSVTGKYRAAVTIIDRNEQIMSSSSEYNRAVALRSLGESGVSISLRTSVKSVEGDSLGLRDEQGVDYRLPADLAIFTAGTEQSPLIKALPVHKVPDLT